MTKFIRPSEASNSFEQEPRANFRRIVNFFYRGSWVLIALLVASVGHARTEAAAKTAIPEIGKFMLTGDGQISQWPESPNDKSALDEPINIVIRVHATNANEAIKRLMQALAAAGFEPRDGHTVGYEATIGNHKFNQLPTGDGEAFSDAWFLAPSNDHGRFFGPMQTSKGEYYFVGSFSRESPNFPQLVEYGKDYFHSYDSFSEARETLAQNLESRGGAKYVRLIPLNNSRKNTGDHDGKAVLLEL